MNYSAEIRDARAVSAWPPLFQDRHVHVGYLVNMIGEVARDAEQELRQAGTEVRLSAGPWGGFNFIVGPDGYTRMPIGRLTVVIGSPAETPLEENGGPVFQAFMPRYIRRLRETGWEVPDAWEFRHPKRTRDGRLLELSCVHYLPGHSYDSRTFLKVRLSREWEAYEEILLRDFLVVLERLYLTTDWNLYREETRLVDVRFDLQDFLSLNYVLGPLYERTPQEEAVLREITDAYLAHTRDAPTLYRFLDRVVSSRWIANVVWSVARAAFGIRPYQRPFSISRDLLVGPLPAGLMVPVKIHLREYHEEVGRRRPPDEPPARALV